MELNVYIQLIFLCVVNIIFSFSGIVSNTLVTVSIWKSSPLRKKLCHFMIMVLSCFDLVTVVTNYPGLFVCLISWLTEDNRLFPEMRMYWHFVSMLFGFSFDVLLVMSIERYLGAYHPIFHRTSVTRRRLLTVLAILLIVHATLDLISVKDILIPRAIVLIISITAVFPPLVYLNFKLFKICRDVRRRKAASPGKRAIINLKSISSCSLAVACLAVLSFPTIAYIVFNIKTENRQASNVILSSLWITTVYTMNCTFNSLIFFWKNKVLRTEGIKILKTFKDRLVEF